MANTPDGWTRTGVALSKTFTFASFDAAMTFANALADYARRHDHHPDMLISYRKVTVTWTTHDAGGVTDKDEAGAAFTERIVGNQ